MVGDGAIGYEWRHALFRWGPVLRRATGCAIHPCRPELFQRVLTHGRWGFWNTKASGTFFFNPWGTLRLRLCNESVASHTGQSSGTYGWIRAARRANIDSPPFTRASVPTGALDIRIMGLSSYSAPLSIKKIVLYRLTCICY